jgi:MoCo/4Fe-4S cofactor protein with predicted Tat translocation signal
MADNIDNLNNNHNEPDPNYWQSFAELYNSYGDIKPENEFLDGVTNDFDPEVHLSQMSRRKFLALLGVSSAFAGVGCSDYPNKGEIIPYNQRP